MKKCMSKVYHITLCTLLGRLLFAASLFLFQINENMPYCLIYIWIQNYSIYYCDIEERPFSYQNTKKAYISFIFISHRWINGSVVEWTDFCLLFKIGPSSPFETFSGGLIWFEYCTNWFEDLYINYWLLLVFPKVMKVLVIVKRYTDSNR